jgi:alpha-amylase
LFICVGIFASVGAQQKPPLVDWATQTVVYEVNLRQYTSPGTFKAFEKSLPRLRQMGVGVLWFMPIQPIGQKDRKGSLGSYYAVSNYRGINPEHGNLQDWLHLVQAAHKAGFKVLIDWVPNHTGADHPWLQQHPAFYVRDPKTDTALAQFDWTDTRKLNYANPALRDSMRNSLLYWLKETGIDGFRFDQAHLVDSSFWQETLPVLRKEKPILLIAESEDPWVHRVGFDLSYPWKYFHTTVDIAAGKKNALALDSIQQVVLTALTPQAGLLYFTSNHDENSWNGADHQTMPQAIHRPFMVLSQTLERSVPLVYSGQEEPLLRPLPFFEKDSILFQQLARSMDYQSLARLRQLHPALHYLSPQTKWVTGKDQQIYAFVRTKAKDKVLVVANLSAQSCTLQAQQMPPGFAPHERLTEWFSGQKTSPIALAQATLSPWEVRIFY